MNLSRAIAASGCSKRTLNLISFLSLFQSSHLSTSSSSSPETPRKPRPKTKPKPSTPLPNPPDSSSSAAAAVQRPDQANWPRPAEVPWQPKVANAVHIIGSVTGVVQFDVTPDGEYVAAALLRHRKTADSPYLWIPIFFEGDLAQIAVCYLKEDDFIYVTGQLSRDPMPFTFKQIQTSIQVTVHNVSFVQKSWMVKEALQQNDLGSPEQIGFDHSGNSKKTAKKEDDGWQDLITNPKHWWDHRLDKKNGMVKPKFPDFKHKATGRPLWLDTASESTKLQLAKIEFDVKRFYPKQESELTEHDSCARKMMGNKGELTEHDSCAKKTMGNKAEDFWKDVLENPHNWYDNRIAKLRPKSPDFRHKATGKALWILDRTTPPWVISKLPFCKTEVRG